MATKKTKETRPKSKKEKIKLPANKEEKIAFLSALYYNFEAETEKELLAKIASLFSISITSIKLIINAKEFEKRKFDKKPPSLNQHKTTNSGDKLTKAKEICDYIAQGYTISASCDKSNTLSQTFWRWRKDYEEIEELCQQALQTYKENFEIEAVQSSQKVMLESMQERKIVEKKTVYAIDKEGQAKAKSVIASEKVITPDARIAQFIYEKIAKKNTQIGGGGALFAMSETQLQELITSYLDADWSEDIPD